MVAKAKWTAEMQNNASVADDEGVHVTLEMPRRSCLWRYHFGHKKWDD